MFKLSERQFLYTFGKTKFLLRKYFLVNGDEIGQKRQIYIY
jgi:hypothetical protein